MRNFEERMAEIHRRSNAVLQRRKMARRIALACIPLVICLGLCTQFLHNLKKNATEAEIPELGSPESIPCGGMENSSNGERSLARVEIRNTLVSQVIADADTVAQVTRWLDSLEDHMVTADSATGDNKLSPEATEEITTGSMDIADIAANVQVITVIRTDGTRTVYTLTDCTLENITDGGRYTLTAQQLQEWNQLLGLS